jgi:hypothetical protein
MKRDWLTISMVPLIWLITACHSSGYRNGDGMSNVSLENLASEISKRNLSFFLQEVHPSSGMVRERALNLGLTPNTDGFCRASIAGVGFSLAVITSAYQQGLLPRSFAESYVLRALQFLDKHYATLTWHGWFLHYFDWENAARFEKSEFSTIDTSWFLAGALYAGQVFPGSLIDKIATKFYRNVDFPIMLTDAMTAPRKKTISMAFTPEDGFTASQWDEYSEQKLLLFLGLGSPTHPLPKVIWTSWNRQTKTFPNGKTLMGADRALFIHQYAQLFLDLRNFNDEGYPNYFQNSVDATLFNRQMSFEDRKSRTFANRYWGLGAGDGPDAAGLSDYRVNTPYHHDDTACLVCVVASAMLAPTLVMEDVSRWINGPDKEKLWGRYGLIEGLNLDKDWVSPLTHALPTGASFLALSNRSEPHLIWKVFGGIPGIKSGLSVASPSKP